MSARFPYLPALRKPTSDVRKRRLLPREMRGNEYRVEGVLDPPDMATLIPRWIPPLLFRRACSAVAFGDDLVQDV